jgi:hypothetical protein
MNDILERAAALIAEELSTIPCGCPKCDHGVQPGHFACGQSDIWALVQEANGEMVRHYDGTRWVWEFV